MCAELEGLWLGVCACDSDALSPAEVVMGFTHHQIRHGCDPLDVRAVSIDVLLLSSADPSTISTLSLEVEGIGGRSLVWREFLLRTLGNLVVFAHDRGSADAVAARRELYRLCRLWELPTDASLWCR